MLTIDPARSVLKRAAWPDRDRDVLEAALQAALGRFSARGYAATLSGRSLFKAEQGYGRWLGYLKYHNVLDPNAEPASRASFEQMSGYFAFLKSQNNADTSILGRFTELRMMLRILDPTCDHLRIVKPHGQPLRNFLKMQRREVIVYDPGVLLDWGISLMEEALANPRHEQRRLRMRTGLMAAFLSLIPLRVRSLLSLELGKSLIQEPDGRWRISLSERQVKNRRAFDVYWPACLAGWLERYLTVERRELLGGKTCDQLWVSSSGHALNKNGTNYSMQTYSAQRFGEEGAFCTHRFRHCLPLSSPSSCPRGPPSRPASSMSAPGPSPRTMIVERASSQRACFTRRWKTGEQRRKRLQPGPSRDDIGAIRPQRTRTTTHEPISFYPPSSRGALRPLLVREPARCVD